MTAVGAFDRSANGIAVGDIGPDEARIARPGRAAGGNWRWRGLPGRRRGPAHIVLEQLLADVAADEAAAAENRDEAGCGRSSRSPLAAGARALTRRPPHRAAAFLESIIVGEGHRDGLAVGLGDRDFGPGRFTRPSCRFEE